MVKYNALLIIIASFLLSSCASKRPHIAFVFGDEEYRSEESMPMLAEILKRELNAKISLCYPLDSNGIVNPNINDNISNLKALEKADLMVVFCRWRKLPDNQRMQIENFVQKGRPIVGFRTSTHTFLYQDDPTRKYYNDQWPYEVFGQQWITHHGHFDDGNLPLTYVFKTDDQASIILNGFTPFDAYSWLYHVDGGEWKLNPNCKPLLYGKSLKSIHEDKGQLDKYALEQPVAWTKPYFTKSGKESRVFFTTLGHPYDFKQESMRRLSVHAIYWALGLESKIPQEGLNIGFASPYEPNNSGFGNKYKPNVRPKLK